MHTNKTQEVWNSHYTKLKSKLTFPDENLVRILSRIDPNLEEKGSALDLGCGSGRHSVLLDSMGWKTTGLDYTKESIHLLNELAPHIKGIVSEAPPYPFADKSFDVVVAWGVLHYNSDEMIAQILQEIKRILKRDGYFIGTVRSQKDTLLSVDKNQEMNLNDLKGGYVQLFDESKLRNILNMFGDVQIGYMERTLLGNMEKIISHYFFQVRNIA
ncbi:MAG: class I SAM-dependent methyltransferase [Leptospira sp.]|nr:class I SAM-dependent methyltransferase [Leptospira sp.]